MSKPSQQGVSTRRLSRLNAVQALYQHELSGDDIEYIINQFTSATFKTYVSLNKILKPEPEFLKELVLGVQAHFPSLDQDISNHLSSGWHLERVSIVTLSILRLAVYELKYQPLTPTPVIINEYIEVTKDFFEEKEAAFVNGILDAIAKKYR